MTRIAFFEPSYVPENARDWEIRGSYKYPSLLGDLHRQAEISVLMATLPPLGDPHRDRLEKEFGARFHALDSLEDARWPAARILFEDYGVAIAEHAPDIVSTLNGRTIGVNFALARAAREAGVDFVYRVAGNDISTQIAVQEAAGRPVSCTSLWGTMAAQEGFAVEAARTVIVMSATERDRIARLTADPAKIAICRRGVDRSHFAPPENPDDRCRRILFVGRNSAEKGIDLIEAAADRLAQSHPGIHFTIAGDFVPRQEKNRRYLGFHSYDRLPELYREHDALVLPARSEGFPQVVMEAMSCGLPAVLSRHLFAGDFAEQGDGVALVELDAEQIAAAIAQWHDDPALFRRLKDDAHEHAASEFDERRNRPLYHRALLSRPTAPEPKASTSALSPMRRYWIATDASIAALAALRDPPRWGPSAIPLTVFLTAPNQASIFRRAEGEFELIDAAEGLVPALVKRLEGETARFVQIAVDPIEDFPASADLLAGELAANSGQAVSSGWLQIAADQSWSQSPGKGDPVWIETVALREAMAELKATDGISAVLVACDRMRPTEVSLPAPVGVVIYTQSGDGDTSRDAPARARIAGAAAEMDWREVRVRVRLDRAAALAARERHEGDHRSEVLSGEFARLHDTIGWAARLRAKLTGWRR